MAPSFLNFQNLPGSYFGSKFAEIPNPIMKRIFIIGGHHYVTRTKIAVNMNQIAMIKLALYLDNNEMSKMISLGQDYTLVNSNANMYIVEYYKNLLKRLENELKAILESIDAKELYIRSALARKTYDMLENILNDEKLGFVKISEIEDEEVKNLITRIGKRQKEMESETEEIIRFFLTLQ